MKTGGRGTVLVMITAIFLAMAIAGCGSSSSTGAVTQAQSKSGGSAAFLGPKGKENTQAKFGEEGSEAELAQVSQIVEKSLEARGQHDWAEQCSTLSIRGKKRVAENSAPKFLKSCAARLGAEASKAPASVLRDNMEGSVVAFRQEEGIGYAFYHGIDKKDWAMPMEKEGTGWKVASPVAEELAR